MSERTVKGRRTAPSSGRSPKKLGDRAPDFQLVDNNLEIKTLADFGSKIKLISVVPSLDTDICDMQTRRFNEEVSKILRSCDYCQRRPALCTGSLVRKCRVEGRYNSLGSP